MRNMSFALTTAQFNNRSKTVTRRLGWANLKPGEVFMGVEKGQGIPKGGKVKKLHTARCKSNRPEKLRRLTDDLDYGFAETAREGFPEGHPLHWPSEFVRFFCEHNGCTPETVVNRIEFEHLTQDPFLPAPSAALSATAGKSCPQ